jgi:hypothetical protein
MCWNGSGDPQIPPRRFDRYDRIRPCNTNTTHSTVDMDNRYLCRYSGHPHYFSEVREHPIATVSAAEPRSVGRAGMHQRRGSSFTAEREMHMAITLSWTRHASSVLYEQHRINFGATSRGEETKGIRSKEKWTKDKSCFPLKTL